MGKTVISVLRSDGGVSVIHNPPADVQTYVRRWEEDMRGVTAVSCKELPESAVPADLSFRNAWNADLVVDMSKARDIHMDRIRAVRDKEMAKLDVEQLKGRDVKAEKDVLREIPQTFDLAQADTPEALKALWPSDLPRE